ncbi:hypothetical protein GTA08_BOTSDO12789 [Neofusicoccum parvum]|uniref:Uncharacterized protein n=1 Tax=Neofusicoccum parvum TaxID=310453 RepID=A0ACB5S1E9_9PEZI|nr:hypothetical protein GTA08_BOTSDO12789 [Neofusicoccum parvum]
MAADHELQQLMPHEGPSTTHGIPLKHNTDDAHATASAAPDSSRSSHDGSKIENDGAPGWTPLYLRATTLAAFVVCYLVLLVAIVALAIADAKNDGLAAAKSNQHYLWTYGPTAVLAIVAALWGQVEHRTKQAMPWHVLQTQPTPASATLLLDYITPSLPETLLQSFRSSHWPVAVATISSLLIKLLTVASTGLLVLQITPVVHHDCRITASDDFVSGFNPAAIGSTAVLSTLAIENGTLPYEPGTTRHQAFQTMNASHSLSNQNAVKVEGFARSFSAGLTCETATVTSYDSFCSDRQCHGIDVHIDIDSPTCHVRQLDYSQGCGWQLGYTECDFEDAFGVECNTTTDGHDRNRLVFMYGRMSQNVSANDLGAKILPNETTTVVCEPKYNITSTFVRTDQNGNLNINASEMVTQGAASRPYPAWDLVEGLHTSVQAAGLILGNPYAYSSVANKPWYQLYMFFDSWADAAYPSSDFRDAQLLETAANDLFAMVSAQMAKQNLVAPSDTEIIGTCYS